MCFICDIWRQKFEDERRRILTDALIEINIPEVILPMPNDPDYDEREVQWRRRQLANIEGFELKEGAVNDDKFSYCWWIYFRYSPDGRFVIIENKLITLMGYWWTTIGRDPITSIKQHFGCFSGCLLIPLCYKPTEWAYRPLIALQCFEMFTNVFLPHLTRSGALEFTTSLNSLSKTRVNRWYRRPASEKTDFVLLSEVNPGILWHNDLLRLLYCFHAYCTIFIEYLNTLIHIKDNRIGAIPGGIDYITYYYFLYFLFVTRPRTPGEALDLDKYKFYRELIQEVPFFQDFLRVYDYIRHEAKGDQYQYAEHRRKRTLEIFYVEILRHFQIQFFKYVDKTSTNAFGYEIDDIWDRQMDWFSFRDRLSLFFIDKLIIIEQECRRITKLMNFLRELNLQNALAYIYRRCPQLLQLFLVDQD